jgi:hypothetical protein
MALHKVALLHRNSEAVSRLMKCSTYHMYACAFVTQLFIHPCGVLLVYQLFALPS